MSTLPQRSGTTEAVVMVKAAPQLGQRHGETVCCAAIDVYGNWLRLYPVSFRTLEPHQKFTRWDRIKFNWRLPNDDHRVESRRVGQESIQIIGELRESERERFLARAIVTGLASERAAGRSLALLKPEVLGFKIEWREQDEVEEDRQRFAEIRAQQDLFSANPVIPYEPCPYRFKYAYRTDDGDREGTCQDWEIEATFFNWSKRYGEAQAIEHMRKRFGEEYPSKGILLAMGTHSRYPDIWLINGIIRLNVQQLAFI
jgi:hypothetical protein